MSGDSLVEAAQDSTTWYTALGPVETIMTTSDSLAAGDWVAGSVNGVFAGVETLAALSDPWGTLISMIGGFIMEHVHPFPEWLDDLCGDPDQIRAFALTWNNVATHVDENADEFISTVRKDAGGWVALAVGAYHVACDALEEVLHGFAGMLRGVGAAVELTAGIVAGVRAIVRDAISEIISWITGAAWKFLTPYLPKGIQELASTVMEWASKVRRFLDDLVTTVESLCTKLDDLTSGMGDAATEIKSTLKSLYELAKEDGIRGRVFDGLSEAMKFNSQYPAATTS